MNMKKLILSAALCVACVPMFAANTNTFVLRPGRPATDAEVLTGTNRVAWTTPAHIEMTRPKTLDTVGGLAEFGSITYGPSTNWTLVDQWLSTPNTRTTAVFTVGYSKILTSTVYNVIASAYCVGDVAGGPQITVHPIAWNTNAVTVRMFFGSPALVDVRTLLRILGK